MAKRRFEKNLSVVIVAVLAITVCLVGLKYNQKRQYDERVTYAEQAIKSEQKQMANLQEVGAALYLDEQHVLLTTDATIDEATKLKTSVEAIKVSADDFNIKKAALPKAASDIARQKQALTDLVTAAVDKLHIQAEIDLLYTEKLPNWQQSTDDLLLADDVTTESISTIKEKLAFFETDGWLDLADHYLSLASDQLALMSEIEQTIKELLKDENIVTYEAYLALMDQITTVKNTKKQAEYKAAATQIAARIGLDTSDEQEEAPSYE